MNVKCEICGQKATGTKDELIEKGWCGIEVIINSKRKKAQFCPGHSGKGVICQVIADQRMMQHSRRKIPFVNCP